jgi:hypothetical protein
MGFSALVLSVSAVLLLAASSPASAFVLNLPPCDHSQHAVSLRGVRAFRAITPMRGSVAWASDPRMGVSATSRLTRKLELRMQQQGVDHVTEKDSAARLKAELDTLYPSQTRPPRSAATNGTLDKSAELRAAEEAARRKVAEAAASGQRRRKAPSSGAVSREAAERLAKAEQDAREAVLASLLAAKNERSCEDVSAVANLEDALFSEQSKEASSVQTLSGDDALSRMSEGEGEGEAGEGEGEGEGEATTSLQSDSHILAVEVKEQTGKGTETQAVAQPDKEQAGVEAVGATVGATSSASSQPWSLADGLFARADADENEVLDFDEFAAMPCNGGVDSALLRAAFERSVMCGVHVCVCVCVVCVCV